MSRKHRILMSTTCAVAIGCAAPALGQETPSEVEAHTLEEVVVTAQKRVQTANDVGLTISAASGDQLAAAGIRDVTELTRIVPGLTYSQSINNTPILTLRGIGFNDYTLGSSPTVSVYGDQVPVPFPSMARGMTMDLERVEVLKGPQGTLFGQNATGGAINYIAAKPTDGLTGGFDASYGRFDEVDAGGYMSGALSDSVRGRVALRTQQSSDWQRNHTSSATLGGKDLVMGRAILEWQPADVASLALNINGWRDKSDSQAAQLTGYTIQRPANVGRADAIRAQPLAPGNARDGNWDDRPFAHDDHHVQISLRGDFQITDGITLTSISSYDDYDEDYALDRDGTGLAVLGVEAKGSIEDFSQELRLSGETERNVWLVGANVFDASTQSRNRVLVADGTVTLTFGIPFATADNLADQDIREYALFANNEFALTDTLTLLAGVRYTESKRDFAGCTTADEGSGRIFSLLSTALSGTPTPVIPVGACFTFDETRKPVDMHRDELDEDNVSWRMGVNYEPSADTLLYALVAKGYKSGAFPTVSASTIDQFAPAVQESVLAYEIGSKLQLFDQTTQLNLSAFYYDYEDKQIRGRVRDPSFGVLERLVNAPQSEVVGGEIQLSWTPLRGLLINASATYLDTKIKEFVGLDQFGVLTDFEGERIPYTPEWQATAAVDYRFPISGSLDVFLGGNLTYNSSTDATLAGNELTHIKDFTVLDLRAGVATQDERWSVNVYGRNVTDEYYWTNAVSTQDVFIRYAAPPATYGVRVAFKY